MLQCETLHVHFLSDMNIYIYIILIDSNVKKTNIPESDHQTISMYLLTLPLKSISAPLLSNSFTASTLSLAAATFRNVSA